jgi:hypothetical protein
MGSSLVLNRRPKVPAEDTAAFGAIAERFRRAGALEQAVSLCRDGLKRFPDHVSARVTLGWSLLDLGKYDEARLELEQVMRRAPDNLAAIRGLAELHDRFEHTLNLPMDGPGQWPPPAESVDGEPESDNAAVVHDERPTVDVADAAAMAPAAMGLPLWTPEPASSPIAEALPVPATSTGSGMSSVREIDVFAGAPLQVAAQVEDDLQLEIDAPVVAVAALAGAQADPQSRVVIEDVTPEATPYVAQDELGVTDDTLAALIAEAESLDAAAALQTVEVSDALELGSVEVELDTAAVEFEAAAPMDLELAHVAQAVDPIVEPVFESAAEPVLESALEAVLEPALEEPAIELEAVAEPEVVAEFAPAEEIEEVQEVEEVEEVAEVRAEVIAFAARSTVVAEDVEPEPMVFLHDEQEEQEEQEDAVAQVVAMPSMSATAARVAALERMLRRVHARRHQLMAESVA